MGVERPIAEDRQPAATGSTCPSVDAVRAEPAGQRWRAYFLEFAQSLAMISGSIRVYPLDENGHHPGGHVGGVDDPCCASHLCLREFRPSDVGGSFRRTMGAGPQRAAPQSRASKHCADKGRSNCGARESTALGRGLRLSRTARRFMRRASRTITRARRSYLSSREVAARAASAPWVSGLACPAPHLILPPAFGGRAHR